MFGFRTYFLPLFCFFPVGSYNALLKYFQNRISQASIRFLVTQSRHHVDQDLKAQSQNPFERHRRHFRNQISLTNQSLKTWRLVYKKHPPPLSLRGLFVSSVQLFDYNQRSPVFDCAFRLRIAVTNASLFAHKRKAVEIGFFSCRLGRHKGQRKCI